MDASGETLVVLTALPLEYKAVRRLLEGLERVDQAGTVFERGRLAGTPWTVYLAATGPGNDSAAVITERAINFVRPQAVFFVGIAGSLKSDVSRGDVVVALEVYAYHGGKESPEGFKGRPRSWETSHPLQQVAMYVHSVDDWRGVLPEAERHTAKVHFKPIAAGDLLLDAPAESPSRVHLDRNYNDAVAVEMEGAGFANAASKAGIPFLLVRGISDLANGTKQSTDGAGTQETAAQHAAVFLAEVIAQYKPANAGPGPTSPASGQRTDELIWQPLDPPAGLAWHRDLVPSSAYMSGPALLEIHLAPVSATSRVTATRMQQLADELVNLGRLNGLFSNTERVEIGSSAEMTVVSVAGRDGRSAGLAITRSGQRSAWESLPHPGMAYVSLPSGSSGRRSTATRSRP
ncbi:5'-methylthioadenosine/S-adenosylhomocysteine nucleosidase [Streptomyces sp. MB09-02B]|uniref:5'-methylthioadenosine/S-adenosylhomocysteine nucleosidase family protein n=1 Tax=Streptomyces sp. MB09-02B TaxID=3028667 RepID=UPI0029A79608|nr:5'-methylthioadenosine/S-adenosylhomocysteine nucleosidase [Streptomyces sp. MB09-02B]MDX3641977.1 5'-methylthioadenosine/S-adenosylhomocysteine nucleosidase [Streptomyces sp. MB09-02B]